jgi:nucleoside-diphosphate-sugar epimerase
VVPLFITAIANGRPVRIEGDGEQRRDFTYVENVVDGTLQAGDAAGVSGRIFNLAASAPASVNELAELIGTIVGRRVERTSAPPRAGDIRSSWADISAARETLGYEPSVGLEEGLSRTVDAIDPRRQN